MRPEHDEAVAPAELEDQAEVDLDHASARPS